METASLDGREAVIIKLQNRLQHLAPGSAEADATEHAIDLAISSTRPCDQYLFYDCLSDARKVLRRSRTREERAYERAIVSKAVSSYIVICNFAEDGDSEVVILPQGSADEPGNVKALLGHLLLRARELGTCGVACLEDLLAGASVAATATRAGVSQTTVKRCRASLRAAACAWQRIEVAA